MTKATGCGIMRKSSGEILCGMGGSIAQLGEHLPYKQGVTGSSPVVPTNGPVVQLVRTLACHARGRGFDPHPSRQIILVSYQNILALHIVVHMPR